MLDRGDAAKYAAPIFFQDQNDFDIYVEDTARGYTKIFALLISRAMNSNFALERVFPLGARPTVISAAELELKKGNGNRRKSVFIVDGDLDLLAKDAENLPENVVSLPRYCIENFMFDENALIEVMDEESAELTAAQLKSQLDYSGWLERSLPSLRSLFIAFATAKRLGAGLPSVSLGHSSICADGTGEISPEKSNELIESIFSELEKAYGVANTETARQFVLGRINGNACFVSTYVSAKDFSLPLLVIRLRRICGTKASNINLKLRLSKKCSVTPLSSVADKIESIVAATA